MPDNLFDSVLLELVYQIYGKSVNLEKVRSHTHRVFQGLVINNVPLLLLGAQASGPTLDLLGHNVHFNGIHGD